MRHVIAKVSQNALVHNLAQVRLNAPHSKVMAMIKANAYGHGLVEVAKTLVNADAFGVASIQEALLLREGQVNNEIVLIEGIFQAEELTTVQNHNFTLVVHHWPQIQALSNYQGLLNKPFRIWIKINTGMNRLGFPVADFEKAYAELIKLPNVEIIGFMTHFSQADEKDNPCTHNQIEQFNALVKHLPGKKCLANSAGILGWKESHADWVRPGLILYGASPFPSLPASNFNLKPAMSLFSEIIAIREITHGEKVGYGGHWQNNRKVSKIGIVSIGYGDGYPWHAKSTTPVLVNGQRTHLAGRVSMDMLAVDLTDIPEVKVGDPVILWGDDLPIEEVALHSATIPYELFCRFTERVTVRVVG